MLAVALAESGLTRRSLPSLSASADEARLLKMHDIYPSLKGNRVVPDVARPSN